MSSVINRMRDDSLHILWGLWAGIVIVNVGYLCLAAPLIVLPREMEQTFNSRRDGRFEGFTLEYFGGKLRDLVGFALGGLLLDVLFRHF